MAKPIRVIVGGHNEAIAKSANPTPLQLYSAINRSDKVFRQLLSIQLKPFKLTYQEWLAIGLVNEQGSTGVNSSALASYLRVPQTRVTAITRSLVDKHLLRQKAVRSDRRSRVLVVTARGRVVLSDVDSVLTRVLEDWLKPIPDNHMAFYLRVVQTMTTLDPPPLEVQRKSSVIK